MITVQHTDTVSVYINNNKCLKIYNRLSAIDAYTSHHFIRNDWNIMENLVCVKLLFFAKSRELAGISECEVNLPKRILYTDLIEYLNKTYNLRSLNSTFLIALNSEYCNESNTSPLDLSVGDELAVIPPISGG